jgi:long-chain acyl-CoA synthetase
MLRKVSDLRDLLDFAADQYGPQAAYLYKEKVGGPYLPISFAQFREDVNAFGSALLAADFKGKHIAVIGENRYEWVVSYFAVACGLGTIVPLDKELPVQEIGALVRRADISAVIYSAKVGSKVKEALADQPSVQLICMDAASSEDGVFSFPGILEKGRELREGGDTRYEDLPVRPDDFCTLIFTSGTTGLAKGVMLCHRNFAYDVSALYQYVELDRFHDRKAALSILPMHHTFEFTADVLGSLHQGGTLAFCEGLKYIARNMEQAEVTYLIAVPLIFENMHSKIWKTAEKNGKADKMRKAIRMIRAISHIDRKASKRAAKMFKEVHDAFGGHIKLFIVGGAAADPNVISNYLAMGINMVQGYGMTECSPIIALNPDYASKPAAVGLPLPGTELYIDEPDADGIGEIICKSPAVMLGYYKDEEETAKVLKDGWLRTGDYGYLDRDGYLYITGRKKNVIVTKNGKNIFPEEVEYYLLKSPYIAETVVKGIEEKGDLIITAEIFCDAEALKAAGSPEGEALQALLKKEIDRANDEMPLYKRVKRFEVRETEFEKTTTKKIKRW